MARACKNIAKETGIAVVALSQLSRGADHASLRMLRGSGQIEESADNLVLIDRPEAYPDNKVKSYSGVFKNNPIEGTAKLILAKGRGVGTGCRIVAFNGEYTDFSDIQKPTENKVFEQTEDLPF
jgi:replicative DNA helicase